MIVGAGEHKYKVVEGWGSGPEGRSFGGVITGAGIDSQDRVYISRRKPPAILVYDREGRYIKTLGEEHFDNPHGVNINSRDELWITDTDNNKVLRLTTDGEILFQLGVQTRPEASVVDFKRPGNVEEVPSGELYVSGGYGEQLVYRMSAEGKLLHSWGSEGTGPGQFKLPHCVRVDRTDRVWVADRTNWRVQIFDSEGKFLEEWKDIGAINDIFFDENDVVHLLDGAARTVGMYRMDGTPVSMWGEEGKAPGQFADPPHAFCVDSHGDMYVCEVPFLDNRIQKFEKIREN